MVKTQRTLHPSPSPCPRLCTCLPVSSYPYIEANQKASNPVDTVIKTSECGHSTTSSWLAVKFGYSPRCSQVVQDPPTTIRTSIINLLSDRVDNLAVEVQVGIATMSGADHSSYGHATQPQLLQSICLACRVTCMVSERGPRLLHPIALWYVHLVLR